MENEKLFSAKEMMNFAWWFSCNSGRFADDESAMKEYLRIWKSEQ